MARNVLDGTFESVVLQSSNLDDGIPEDMKDKVNTRCFKQCNNWLFAQQWVLTT